MHCFDYNAVVYDGAVYCTACLPDGIDENSEEVSPIFADSECDCYPVCEHCGSEHDYVTLTSYGERQRYLQSEPEVISKLRDEHAKLPSYAWPGGYPLVYLTVTNDTLCPDCANRHTNYRDPIQSYDIHYAGAPICCDKCNVEIASAYGDPEESV